MSNPVYPRTIADEMTALRKLAAEALHTAKRRGALNTIGGLLRILNGGTITGENASGTTVVTLGSLGDGRTGVDFANADGESVISVDDSGLDRPYIPVPFYRASSAAWVSITAGAPISEFIADVVRQHSGIKVEVLLIVDSGFTVTLELYDHALGTAITTTAVAGPYSDVVTLSAPLSGAHMEPRVISVRAGGGSAACLFQIRAAYTQPAAP